MSSKFKVQSSKFKTEDRRQKTEDRRINSKIQSPKSKGKDRRPKTEDRRQNSALNTQNSALIFGVLPVLESLRAGNRRIEKILIAEGAREKRISEIWELAKQNRVQIQKMPRENLSKYTEIGANHQGVIALVASADYTDAEELLEKIAAKENSLSLILDGVEDPRNLGAILRAAECAGADGVFIPEHRAAGLTETVVKTSAGATEYIKVAKVKNLNRLIEELKKHNIWVVGTSAEAGMDYTEWDWSQSSALVLGSEGKGLHRLVTEKCDALVKIPMRGKIESLNVSVACGVILFEAVRQRGIKC